MEAGRTMTVCKLSASGDPLSSIEFGSGALNDAPDLLTVRRRKSYDSTRLGKQRDEWYKVSEKWDTNTSVQYLLVPYWNTSSASVQSFVISAQFPATLCQTGRLSFWCLYCGRDGKSEGQSLQGRRARHYGMAYQRYLVPALPAILNARKITPSFAALEMKGELHLVGWITNFGLDIELLLAGAGSFPEPRHAQTQNARSKSCSLTSPRGVSKQNLRQEPLKEQLGLVQ
ncbi:hypothetical protein C8F04DRAFT_1180782 [Mycena alexandri]|uniref:Uncharacterized protein n=1 Tax=Mycena alexandri TaxID=1745969 RepID=A0AAD6X9H2_9AGAR|nr:hypothetical protein C8F04DRAFT_1180782 [Mycena alexandri]